MLKDADKKEIQNRLNDMKGPVRLVLFTQQLKKKNKSDLIIPRRIICLLV